MKRDKAIDIIKEMPKEFKLEELLEKLIFIDRVEGGLNQLASNKVVSHEAVKNYNQRKC